MLTFYAYDFCLAFTTLYKEIILLNQIRFFMYAFSLY